MFHVKQFTTMLNNLKKNKMTILYKNWTIHNLLAHPLSEIVWLISFGKCEKISNYIHDVTIPKDSDNNRG